MGLLDFLFAGTVINNVKKARHNNSQQTLHGRVSDYDHGYEDGYDDSFYDHGYHDNYDCHDTYDCGGYDDDCCDTKRILPFKRLYTWPFVSGIKYPGESKAGSSYIKS